MPFIVLFPFLFIQSYQSIGVFFLLIFVLTVCIILAYYIVILDKKKDLHRQYILGKWVRQGKNVEGKAWFIELNITTQDIHLNGEPSINLSARYRFLKEQENLIHLEFLSVSQANEWFKVGRHQLSIDKKAKRIQLFGQFFYKA